MKWYLNMKIGRKLVSGFVLVALISAAMGVYAMYNLKTLDDSDTELYENMTVPLSQIGMISTEFQRTRVYARDIIIAETPEEIQASVDKIMEIRSRVEELTAEFEATIQTEETKQAFEEYQTAKAAFREGLAKVIELARENRDAEAVAMMSAGGESGRNSQAYQSAIDKLVTLKIDDAREKAEENTAQAYRTMTITIVVVAIVVFLSIFIGVFISMLITKPCKKLVHMIREMSRGHFGERLNLATKDEIGQMAEAMDFFADELQTKVIGVMNSISAGDVSMEITVKDEKDEIAPAMKKTVETIRGLNEEVQVLIRAAAEGKLDQRGQSESYSGAWKDMIEGINGLVDAFVAPINLTAEYVERISRGDIPPGITDTYLGDFNEIKNSINSCIDVMNALLSDTNRLIQAAREGKLDARGNSDAYNGDWSTLVKGINSLIDAFAAPINVTAEYVERISKGDIPDHITDTYYGDFNEIKNNINQCIDVMNGLLSETGTLIQAAGEGRLDVRSDASAFTGEWGTLVGGMNDLVDAFTAPINLTAEYVERISKGDIPDKIMEDYQGDFNKIKNSLNNCIDIMNGLISETVQLIGAAREGQLDARADASFFNGAWEELVSGVNRLVEAVVKPISEVTAVMNEISMGNLGVSVQGEYRGEFEVLSAAVNRTAGDLKAVVGEISSTLEQISEGNLALGRIREYRGDFISISDSLNTIVDSLNSVLGEINTASDQVTIGSRQVSDGSQALSQGATEQASSVEELTASVSEVASKTKENAGSANTANELTAAVKESAELGNRHMAEMLQAMEEINDSSNNISRIIKVIDDIAFQTNILALNAAVEAARAGQHGKGFAVVAEEVRTLAARSADAAKDTTELIQGSMRKSSAGTDIANNTAKALVEIVDGVSKTAEIIAEIAQSSNEQATGISQINTSLTQVSQVVQNNAATAEQSAASSQELSGQAELLKQMIGRFKLRKNHDLSGEVRLLKSSGKGDCEEAPRIILDTYESDKY